MTTAAETVPQAPPSPARLFGWGAAWIVVAALAFIVLADAGRAALDFELRGQRTSGIVLATPIIASAVAVIVLVRAFWSIGASRRYREKWTAPERAEFERARLGSQPTTFFFVVAGIAAVPALAGLVAVAIFLQALRENPTGLSLAVVLISLVAMLSVAALQAGMRRRRARRVS
jgi:hypothetical protein